MESPPVKRELFLAVIPFQVLSDESSVKLFGQGLSMDLITDLTRFRPFRVIAYETIKELVTGSDYSGNIIEDLRLDYMIKGMLRYQNKQLLINVQLINVLQNSIVWAEKLTGSLEEFFRIQEKIVEKIVGSLHHFLDNDVLANLHNKPITGLNVYELWLRGYQELKRGTVEADEQARTLFQQAIELDSGYSRAYTGMSLSYFNEWSCQLWNRWDVARNGAFQWAQKALELDPRDHISNAILGRIHLFNGDYEQAEHLLRNSLDMNSNDAETLSIIALGFIYLGLTDEARELYERVRRINPAEDFHSHACGTFVRFEMGEFEEAIEIAERYQLGKGWVDFPAFKAAAYFFQGNETKMRESWNDFLSEFSRKINGGKPADTPSALRWMINVNPYRDETRLKPFWEHMSQTDPNELKVEKPEEHYLPENSFISSGSLWTISFHGQQIQLPDLKGCGDLAKLLAQPRRPVHCTDLMGAEVLESGQEVIDKQAKTEYRNRILDIQQQMEEAETAYDSQKLAALQEEYDQILGHLSQSLGVAGKSRKVSGTVERCRSAVTWRIRSAIKKIDEVHPALGDHLGNSIRTGNFCEYTPEYNIEWILE